MHVQKQLPNIIINVKMIFYYCTAPSQNTSIFYTYNTINLKYTYLHTIFHNIIPK